MAYTVYSRPDQTAESPTAVGDEAARRALEEEQRRQEELDRYIRENAASRQSSNQSASEQPGLGGMGGFQSFLGGGGAGAASSSGSGAAGTSVAHTGAAFSGSSGSGAGSAASSAGSSIWGFWPLAVVAAIIGNETYQTEHGNREGEHYPLEWGLEGRAFYKDKDVWAKKADKLVPGLGDDIKIAGDMSSPLDMFKSSTWKDMAGALKRGGLVGGLLREAF